MVVSLTHWAAITIASEVGTIATVGHWLDNLSAPKRRHFAHLRSALAKVALPCLQSHTTVIFMVGGRTRTEIARTLDRKC